MKFDIAALQEKKYKESFFGFLLRRLQKKNFDSEQGGFLAREMIVF